MPTSNDMGIVFTKISEHSDDSDAKALKSESFRELYTWNVWNDKAIAVSPLF